MPATEKLPGIHYVEYLTHREIERDREAILIAAAAANQEPAATNAYAAHRQSATALMSFFHQRVYIRDARNDEGHWILGNYFVHSVESSEKQDEALLYLTISKDGKEAEAFRVAVVLRTYIMYAK